MLSCACEKLAFALGIDRGMKLGEVDQVQMAGVLRGVDVTSCGTENMRPDPER